MSRARLLLITPDGDISEEFQLDGPNIIIGRAPQSNVVISNTDVSRLHAQIVSTPNGYFVSDMGSTNGTFLNGSLIKPKQMFQLKSNDQVNLGRVSLLFQIVSDSLPSLNGSTQRMTAQNSAKAIPQVTAQTASFEETNHKQSTSSVQAQTALHEPTNHPYAAPLQGQAFPAETFNQALYVQSSQMNLESAMLGYASAKPAFNEDELALANEIFGNELNSKKKAGGVSWASWNKTDLFNKKAKASSSEILPDFSEEELMQQVFGSSSASPENPQSSQQIATELPNTGTIPEGISFETKPGLGLAKYEPPSPQAPAPASAVYEIPEAYTVDTKSYYYPQAKTEDPNKFLPEDYAYDENKQSSRDPFADLKFKDEDSLFAQFSSHSGKALFSEKLETLPKGLDIGTVIKKYALPIGVLVGACLVAVVLVMRHSGVFG